MASGKHFERFSTFSGVFELSEHFWTFWRVFGCFWTFGAIFIRGAIFIIDPLWPGVPGFCQNVPGAAGAAAAAAAGAAAATALIFPTTHVVAKIQVATASTPAAAPAAAPATFWQNPGIPGHRYPFGKV